MKQEGKPTQGMGKRLVAALSALAMLISLSPVALAEETAVLDESTAQVQQVDDPSAESDVSAEGSTESEEEVLAEEASKEGTPEAPEETEESEAAEELKEQTVMSISAAGEVPEEQPVETPESAQELVEEEAESYDASSNDVVVYSCGSKAVIAYTNYGVAPGITETDVILNDSTGKAQVLGYMATIDVNNPTVEIRGSYKGYYSGTNSNEWAVNENWGLEKTTDQAAVYEKATGQNVVFATNGDYFNMQTGQPRGTLVLRGVEQNPGKATSPYFAVLEDGTAVIRDAGTDQSDVEEAIGGPFLLVKNGKNVADNGTDLMPRNSVGVKADGTVVFFLADGRQEPRTVGMTLHDMADFLIAQGVVDALYLDGGGSATYVTERAGSGNLEVRNSPSDGMERSVSSAILVISNAQGDGVFAQAVLTPSNEWYSPYSEVKFSATGVDASGKPADLPADLKWQLSEESKTLGSIDSNGVFTSNGTPGTVKVEMVQQDKMVGATTILIKEPDELYFGSASVSMDFGERSDLGLTARADNRVLNINSNGFRWEIPEVQTGDQKQTLGSMDGNTFVAAEGTETLKGTVKVSYTKKDGSVLDASINIEVGKLPVVAFDFEPDEDGNPLTGAHYHWGSSAFNNASNTNGRTGYVGNFPTITCYTSGRYTDNPVQTELTAPFIFTGNWDTSVPASDVFAANGYDFYLWPNGTIKTYDVGRVSFPTAEQGGQVRFGDYAMELNYDYASYDGSANANFYIRYCGKEPIYIDGTPNQLGCWVYADESSAGYVLYGQVAVWDGSDYITKYWPLSYGEDDPGYIDFTGWKYMYADISSIAQNISEEHPAAIIPGNGVLWLSYQPGKGRGGRYAGTLYFDNFRFVYGTNLDDLTNPVIGSVQVNGIDLNDDDIVTISPEDLFEITATYDDPESDNRTGIDASRTSIKVDGQEVSADAGTLNAVTRLALPEGVHSVQVSACDGFGNTGTRTCYFRVGTSGDIKSCLALDGSDDVVMGGDYTLTLSAQNAVSAASMEIIRLNSDMGEPTVTFSDGWTGTATYVTTGFKKAKLIIEATSSGNASSGPIAYLTFHIPATLDPEVDFFTYQVVTACYTMANGNMATCSQPAVKKQVKAYYTLDLGIAMEGYSTLLTVSGPDGGAGVPVLVNGESVGSTDENGQIQIQASVGMQGGDTFVVQAKQGDHVSFAKTVTVMAVAGNEDGKPSGITLVPNSTTGTKKTITWLSNPKSTEDTPVVQCVPATDYHNGTWNYRLTYDEGTSELYAFATDKKVARINSVTMEEGLKPDTTYYYRVGDGKDGHWSETATFRTGSDKNTTTFFVLGDTQMNGDLEADAESIQLMSAIGEKVKEADFGIQTGDYVDNGGNYGMWEEIQDVVYSEFAGIDLIHTLGNHEYYGDLQGETANKIFDFANGDHNSYAYGNVYVAAINYAADWEESLNWLIEDAQNTNAQWKILVIHQPPYYTNTTGNSELFNQMVPEAAQKAGINLVFSGHDHSYARTENMTDGQVNPGQDEDGNVLATYGKGITYFICGDLGEKSRDINYKIYETPEFHFVKTSQDYTATYLMVDANAESLTVTAYDIQGDGTQEVLDTYTMYTEAGACVANGHVLTESTPVCDHGKLVCNNCGALIDPAQVKYTGWATDQETGRRMYFVAGEAQKGEFVLDTDRYYFDENGVAYDGKVTLDEVELEFDNGQIVDGYTGFVKKSNGNTYRYENGVMTHGWYQEGGNWYHFNTETGVMNTQTHVWPDAQARSKNAYFDFGEDGKLLRGYASPSYYYWPGQQDNQVICLPHANAWVKNGYDPDPEAWYRTNDTGHYVTDPKLPKESTVDIAVDGVVYTFDNDNGKLIDGSIVNKNGTLYYYWAGEPRNDGWFERDGSTYYAYPDGHLAKGSVVINGEEKAFAPDGKLITEGTILYASLSEDNGYITVKLVQAPEDLTKVRFAIWATEDRKGTFRWVNAEKDGNGLWKTVEPMCEFGAKSADTFQIHAYATVDGTESIVTTTTVEVPEVVGHLYTDDSDATCNRCDYVREVKPVRIETVPMFRLYNPNTGEHFYTGSEEERDNLSALGWNYEGISWNAPVYEGDPVYRLCNPNTGDHHYTMSWKEVNDLRGEGWQYEGVAWNSAAAIEANIPQFRLYNPNAECGIHHYTSSEEERDNLVALGWIYEGLAWYGTLQ